MAPRSVQHLHCADATLVKAAFLHLLASGIGLVRKSDPYFCLGGSTGCVELVGYGE